MAQSKFTAVHPVLPVRNVIASLEYYVKKLGFTIAFANHNESPSYAGITRDGVEIHIQLHSSEEWEQMSASSLRFVIEDIQSLFEEYESQDVFHGKTSIKETSWGTQEFAFYDPDMNGLTFYRDL